jgi:hypothetical protein
VLLTPKQHCTQDTPFCVGTSVTGITAVHGVGGCVVVAVAVVVAEVDVVTAAFVVVVTLGVVVVTAAFVVVVAPDDVEEVTPTVVGVVVALGEVVLIIVVVGVVVEVTTVVATLVVVGLVVVDAVNPANCTPIPTIEVASGCIVSENAGPVAPVQENESTMVSPLTDCMDSVHFTGNDVMVHTQELQIHDASPVPRVIPTQVAPLLTEMFTETTGMVVPRINSFVNPDR